MRRDIALRIAIIGLGTIGSTVAELLTAAGVDVIVAQRNLQKAQQLASTLGAHATVMPIKEAVEAGNIVILAIWFDVMKQFIADHRRSLSGKIVVDPSNPIAPDGHGGFKKIIAEDQSSGEIVAGLLPEDAKSVKAFGTISGQSLKCAANRTPERAVLFYATDFPEAGRAVAKLIVASGFSPVRVGGINQSNRIEVGGELHEYGKLGRLVSAGEAQALLSR